MAEEADSKLRGASPGSLTILIDIVKAKRDNEALRQLWERCHARLIRLALAQLRSIPSRLRDEEQVALDAFEEFALQVAEDNFSNLDDRDDLWQILYRLTECTAIDAKRFWGAGIRDWKRHGGESGLATGNDADALEDGFAALADNTFSPEDGALFAEAFQDRLQALRDVDPHKTELTTIAIMKLRGFSTDEIAVELGRSSRHVRRRLKWIRECWAGR